MNEYPGINTESLTAAQVGGAPGVFANGHPGIIDWDVAVGARVVRAKRLATLGHLASVAVALNVHGVRDRGVAIRAADGVAPLRLPWNSYQEVNDKDLYGGGGGRGNRS